MDRHAPSPIHRAKREIYNYEDDRRDPNDEQAPTVMRNDRSDVPAHIRFVGELPENACVSCG